MNYHVYIYILFKRESVVFIFISIFFLKNQNNKTLNKDIYRVPDHQMKKGKVAHMDFRGLS